MSYWLIFDNWLTNDFALYQPYIISVHTTKIVTYTSTTTWLLSKLNANEFHLFYCICLQHMCFIQTSIPKGMNSWVDNSIWKIPRYLTDKSECPAFGQRTTTTTSHPFVRSNEVFWSAMAIRDMLTFLIGFSPSISNPNSDDRDTCSY